MKQNVPEAKKHLFIKVKDIPGFLPVMLIFPVMMLLWWRYTYDTVPLYIISGTDTVLHQFQFHIYFYSFI